MQLQVVAGCWTCCAPAASANVSVMKTEMLRMAVTPAPTVASYYTGARFMAKPSSAPPNASWSALPGTDN